MYLIFFIFNSYYFLCLFYLFFLREGAQVIGRGGGEGELHSLPSLNVVQMSPLHKLSEKQLAIEN